MIESLESRIAPATFIVTSLADSGPGTLRDAITQANDNEGPDTIVFGKELTGTIKLAGEQLAITDTLTIKGPGASKLAIDGDSKSRIFSVTDFSDETDSKLTVSGLSFHHGVPQPLDTAGGAIASTESLAIKDCVFTGNTSTLSGGAIQIFQPGEGSTPINLDVRNSSFGFNVAANLGGAINASITGSTTIKNTIFQQNSAGTRGGAVFIELPADGKALLQGCKFLTNNSQFGGAVGLAGESATTAIIRASVLTDNFAAHDGGAINLVLPSTPDSGVVLKIIGSIISGNRSEKGAGVFTDFGSGRLDVSGSRFEGNFAFEDGGGIYLNEDANTFLGADLIISKTKIIGNIAGGGTGGGINAFGNGELFIQSSQFLHNRSENGGGLFIAKQTAATIVGTLIAENTAENGGGISALSDLNLRSTRLLANLADGAGAINSRGDLILQSCLIARNIASAGAAISRDNDFELSLKNTRIVDNVSEVGEPIAEF